MQIKGYKYVNGEKLWLKNLHLMGSVLGGPCEEVHHAIGRTAEVHIDYIRLPIQTLKVGSLGTHKALGLAKASGHPVAVACTSGVVTSGLIAEAPDYAVADTDSGRTGDTLASLYAATPTEGVDPGNWPSQRWPRSRSIRITARRSGSSSRCTRSAATGKS